MLRPAGSAGASAIGQPQHAAAAAARSLLTAATLPKAPVQLTNVLQAQPLCSATAPPALTNTLQDYLQQHRQLQRGHQLCMQSAVASRQASGGMLNAAAQLKLAQLLAEQQMQLQLQEELLQTLAQCSDRM
jgi:hypothetical protein